MLSTDTTKLHAIDCLSRVTQNQQIFRQDTLHLSMVTRAVYGRNLL
uniref:Uncharacterized protein n=1 Tax=Anguilla anguilla TaxID=7936 RepID=A0A0E9QTX8_ANGAN